MWSGVDLTGRTLGHVYRLERLLAVGGMASVYTATHTPTGRQVAAKVLHRDLTADPEARARVLAEARAANRVRHPGVVRVLDADTDEAGAAYLILEWLSGDTIEHALMRPGYAACARDVAGLLYELLDILAAAHDRGVVHRDVKPSNVFLTWSGAVKLLDFGIASVRGASLVPDGARALGTPAFMAPEQVGGTGDVDLRSDLWSAAATAFVLLSGRPVHDGPTPRETIVACASRAAPPLASVAPAVGAPLARVIDRALLFRKEDRWSSAGEMQAAVAAAQREMFGSRVACVSGCLRRRDAGAVCSPTVESPSAESRRTTRDGAGAGSRGLTPPCPTARASASANETPAARPPAAPVSPTLRSLTGSWLMSRRA